MGTYGDIRSDTGAATVAESAAPASSPARRFIVGYIRLLLRLFFRRIEVAGLENVPREGGGLLFCWHPNGWIDGAVVLTSFPHSLVACGRHGILDMPILGSLMRQCGAIPVYREQDASAGQPAGDRQARNREAMNALARAVARGNFALIFPEGLSHDDPFPHPLKRGAAHLYYRAVELSPAGSAPPPIIPVALHYNKKSIWGSQVLLTFHPPMALPPELARPADSEEGRKQQARQLTHEMERVLRDVVLATDSWDLHHHLQRARKLIRAEGAARRGARSEPSSISKRVRHFGHAWKNYQLAIKHFPAETEEIFAKLAVYDWNLRALRVEDHELDRVGWNLSTRKTVLVALAVLVAWLALPFFLVIGILVNLPTILLLQALAKTASAKSKDEASIKLLAGAVAFPVTWLVAAVLIAWGGSVLAKDSLVGFSPLLTGVVAFALSWFGGLLVVHFRQITSETLRALSVAFTLTRRRHAVRELLQQRAELYERFIDLDARLENHRAAAQSPPSTISR